MSQFVRASKVRHVFCDPVKPEHTYQNFKLSTATGDHNYIKGNTKYFAVPTSAGGGALAIVPYEREGKQDAQPPCLDAHKGPVLDFDFNPFHDHIIATGGDDAHIMVWGITPGGLTADMREPLVDISEHQRKVSVMLFHPTAEHVLASGSADNFVKILDVEKGASQFSVEHTGGVIYDVAWSYTGDQLFSACKDKFVRIIDPRSGKFAGEVEAHEGTKTTKLCFLGKEEKLLTAGFTRQSKRQFKIWDPRKFTKEIATSDIDQAAGVLMPFYDEDTNLLYLTGKGDGNIRYYEIVNDEPWQFFIGEYRSTTPCRGMAMLPKRICDVMKCEVARMLKLGTANVEPLPFIIPRKSDLFQADLFPQCRSGKPSTNATEFFGGKSAKPQLMELDPKKRPADGAVAAAKSFSAPKSVGQLNTELDAAHKRIAELEAKLKAANISF